MTTEETKSILLNTAWLGTNKDREKTEEAVRVVIETLEPKTGHWEETRYRSYDAQSCETYDDGVGFRCSNCANVFKVTSLARYRYCPNCGARMSED